MIMLNFSPVCHPELTAHLLTKGSKLKNKLQHKKCIYMSTDNFLFQNISGV